MIRRALGHNCRAGTHHRACTLPSSVVWRTVHLVLGCLDYVEGFSHAIILPLVLHHFGLLLHLLRRAELVLILIQVVHADLVWIGEGRVLQVHARIQSDLPAVRGCVLRVHLGCLLDGRAHPHHLIIQVAIDLQNLTSYLVEAHRRILTMLLLHHAVIAQVWH